MPLISAIQKQKEVDLCEFKGSLVYIESSRPAGTKEGPCLKKSKKNLFFIFLFYVYECM